MSEDLTTLKLRLSLYLFSQRRQRRHSIDNVISRDATRLSSRKKKEESNMKPDTRASRVRVIDGVLMGLRRRVGERYLCAARDRGVCKYVCRDKHNRDETGRQFRLSLWAAFIAKF